MGTKIEWSNRTWNPWWGCDEISPECGKQGGGSTGRCYAARFASRGMHPFAEGVAARGQWTGKIARNTEKVWREPFTWRAPQRVFTCSMSDFWHESVPVAWLDEALDIIERTPEHNYQVLTKQPGNIARRLADMRRNLPANVWLGVTIGHTNSLPRLKPLLRLDARVRFLSCEPLLTPLVPGLSLTGIHWVIGGGQSGPGAAVCNPEWMRAIRDLCVTNHVPFFLKQWGTWASNPTPRHLELAGSGTSGGATLDGRLWQAYPCLEDEHQTLVMRGRCWLGG